MTTAGGTGSHSYEAGPGPALSPDTRRRSTGRRAQHSSFLLFGTIAWKGADDVGAAFKYVLNRYGSLAADLGFVARTRQKLWRARG